MKKTSLNHSETHPCTAPRRTKIIRANTKDNKIRNQQTRRFDLSTEKRDILKCRVNRGTAKRAVVGCEGHLIAAVNIVNADGSKPNPKKVMIAEFAPAMFLENIYIYEE